MDPRGLEPRASSVRTRCSTHVSYRPGPPRGRRDGYSVPPGRASTIPGRPRRPFLPFLIASTISRNGQTERALTGPSRSSRTNQSATRACFACPVSGADRALRPTAERPAGQRPTAACWGCVGDGGAGRFLVVRRPALRLCTTLSLFTCGALACSVVEEGIEPSRPSRVPVSFEPGALNLSATPPGAVWLFAPITHGLHRIIRNRRRLFRPCRDPCRSPLGSRPGKQAPRAEAETRTCVSPLAIAMQFGE